jgi:hypothetical protein
MEHQIISVRLDNSLSSTEEHIIAIKLSSGTIQTVQQVISAIDWNHKYYFTDFKGNKSYIEVVRPSNSSAYIRTKQNKTLADNLLNLARF